MSIITLQQYHDDQPRIERAIRNRAIERLIVYSRREPTGVDTGGGYGSPVPYRTYGRIESE